jgi:hypothetical protein
MYKKDGTDSAYILYAHYHSPIFFISERDVLDKRIEFVHNGIYYNLSTSVDDELLPPEQNIVRIRNYTNLFIIKEDEDYFYFKGFNQIDMKMNLPDTFFNMILPFKVMTFYKTLLEIMNKD